MDTTASHARGSLPRIALIGAGIAFAWLGLSLVFGVGSAHAADPSDDERSVLGAVTGLVEKTAPKATATVTATTADVTAVVAEVVEVVPAPVQQPVKAVVAPVSEVVKAAATPVKKVVDQGVVKKATAPVVAIVKTVADPVVDLVATVPVVKDVIAITGVDDVVSDLGDAVTDTSTAIDDTLIDLVDVVSETTQSASKPAEVATSSPDTFEAPAQLPASSGGPVTGLAVVNSAGDISVMSFATQLALAWGASTPLAYLTHNSASTAPPTASIASSAPLLSAGSPLTSTAALGPSTLASSGSSGAGPGAWALVAFCPLVAHRAWVRRAGPEDEHAPPAPLFGTEVSPD
ncbi:hypothetical protein ACWPKO_26835 (plasmid) [Coraliomargarita sp. W4R53]